MSRLSAFAAVLALFFGSFLLTGTAHASTNLGTAVLAKAELKAGDWYSYGSDGPSAFDCSGLVYWASEQLGIRMPRDTPSMLSAGVADGVLVPTAHPVAGDLAFFGTEHVEIVAHGHDRTFGAQRTGTRVGFHTWNAYWHPTMFFAIR
jgi:cell wall-associated NlpC family hydrolase